MNDGCVQSGERQTDEYMCLSIVFYGLYMCNIGTSIFSLSDHCNMMSFFLKSSFTITVVVFFINIRSSVSMQLLFIFSYLPEWKQMLHEKRFFAFEIKSFDDRLFVILTNLFSWILSFLLVCWVTMFKKFRKRKQRVHQLWLVW